MANPQPDKFIRISTELFDAIIRVHFPGTARQIFDHILRMTYGHNRKTFDTTQHEIAKVLELKQQRVFEALKWLVDKNMIINTKNRVVLDRNCLTTLGIQKDYDEWTNNTENRNNTEKRVVNNTENRVRTLLKTIDKKEKSLNNTEKRVVFKVPKGEELKSNGHTWIDVSAWDDFVQHRKEIKKPLTSLAVKKSLQLLQSYQTNQREIIDLSIRNGWQGIFAPKYHAKQQEQSKPVKYSNPEEDRAKFGL